MSPEQSVDDFFVPVVRHPWRKRVFRGRWRAERDELIVSREEYGRAVWTENIREVEDRLAGFVG